MPYSQSFPLLTGRSLTSASIFHAGLTRSDVYKNLTKYHFKFNKKPPPLTNQKTSWLLTQTTSIVFRTYIWDSFESKSPLPRSIEDLRWCVSWNNQPSYSTTLWYYLAKCFRFLFTYFYESSSSIKWFLMNGWNFLELNWNFTSLIH